MNRNKRIKLINDYLRETCPSTQREIRALIAEGVIIVKWERGVIKLWITEPARNDEVSLLVKEGRRPTLPPNEHFVQNTQRI